MGVIFRKKKWSQQKAGGCLDHPLQNQTKNKNLLGKKFFTVSKNIS